VKKRKEFTRKVRAQIIKRAAGNCEQCQAVLKKGEGEIDHILPDALEGDNSLENGKLLCKICHKAKTKKDVQQIRKADRQRDKNNGAIRAKSKIKSGGFSKPDKPPKGKATSSLPPRRLYQKKG